MTTNQRITAADLFDSYNYLAPEAVEAIYGETGLRPESRHATIRRGMCCAAGAIAMYLGCPCDEIVSRYSFIGFDRGLEGREDARLSAGKAYKHGAHLRKIVGAK